jgi:hypothetical protein
VTPANLDHAIGKLLLRKVEIDAFGYGLSVRCVARRRKQPAGP